MLVCKTALNGAGQRKRAVNVQQAEKMSSSKSVRGLPPARPHGEIERIAEDVFYVEGTMRTGLTTYARGMTIVRENGDLTLINPIRLKESGENELKQLGNICYVIRLGLHDTDIGYYSRKFGVQVMGFEGVQYIHEVTASKTLGKDDLPFSNCELIVFDTLPTKFSEGALLLKRDAGNILITCDSLQNWEVLKANLLGKWVLAMRGFKGKCIFDRYWMGWLMKEGMSMSDIKTQMQKLVDSDFHILLSGHGRVTDGSAKEATQRSFESMFRDV